MKHLFINKNSKVTLVLFHGTGGSKEEMVSIGELIDSTANILSLDGNINEHGSKRFFKRFSLGVYDLKNLDEETLYLFNTFAELILKYQLNKENMVLIGYSNGANFIQNYIRKFPKEFNYFIFFHSSLIENKPFPILENKHLFLANANNDPMTSLEDVEVLYSLFKHSKINIHRVLDYSAHNLTYEVIDEAKKWLKTQFKG